uniref:CCHC-type domain-containing protein n=1 Tax=Populus alba TaxID=43335 RepID=A0A4U5N9T9_POPAL|nr:hypothetical protein D5086_0000281560 [Populus alba]
MADVPEEKSAGNASIPPQYIPVSNTKFEVEKFDGKGNFGMWKCEVMDMLVQMNLDFTLEDKPEDLDEKSWERINRLACSSIRLCLVKDQKYAFSEQNSAKELWQALEDKFMKKSIENRLYLKKRIFRFQHKKGTSMNEHLNDFNKMIADLKNLDVEIDDEDKALLLLNSLPDTYEHLVTTLLYGKEKIKFIDVSNALVNNEYRKKDQIVHKESTSEALTVRGRTNPRRFRGRGRSRSKSRGESSNRRYLAKDECAFCHKKGHWKKDCPIKGNKEKDEPTVNVAREEDERDSAFMVSSPEKTFVEKSQEKEKQSGDAQQVELETSIIPIKTVQTIPTEGDSDESSDEEDATTPATTQQESIAMSKPKRVIKKPARIVKVIFRPDQSAVNNEEKDVAKAEGKVSDKQHPEDIASFGGCRLDTCGHLAAIIYVVNSDGYYSCS